MNLIKGAAKGQALVEYILIVVLTAIVAIGAMMILGPIIEDSYTTSWSGEVVTPIYLGETQIAHPSYISSKPETKYFEGGEWVRLYPTKMTVRGCTGMGLPKDAYRLYVATTANSEVAGMVDIQLPIPGAEMINICAPEGVEVDLYLWYEE